MPVTQAHTSHSGSTTQWQAALLGYVLMFSVGTFYAISFVQFELPRVLDIPQAWSFAPFGATSLGLALGVYICTGTMARFGVECTAIIGAATWGAGVAAAGYCLARLTMLGISAAFFAGGVGVGIAYLGVVVLIGKAFPTQPLARSAIGPLGFSSGTAACLAARNYLQPQILNASQLGKILQSGGVLIVATALLLLFTTANNGGARSGLFAAPVYDQQYNKTRRNYSILLFSNALPGMIVFSGLLPLASLYKQEDEKNFEIVLPFCMMALALGGLFAPRFGSRLGAKFTFTMLFFVRGCLLIAAFMQPLLPKIGLVTLLVILYAHGVGFSLLPGLVQVRAKVPLQFAHSYGEILIAWGAAGLVGSIVNAMFLTTIG